MRISMNFETKCRKSCVDHTHTHTHLNPTMMQPMISMKSLFLHFYPVFSFNLRSAVVASNFDVICGTVIYAEKNPKFPGHKATMGNNGQCNQ